jgi:hypothetical protein
MSGSLREVFDAIDLNNDGVISKDEFKKAFTGRRKAELRGKFDAVGVSWKQVFDAMDNDKSGAIDFKEFERAAGVAGGKPLSQYPEDVQMEVAAAKERAARRAAAVVPGPYGNFSAVDKNNDGIVDTKEYADAVKSGKVPGYPGYGYPGYGYPGYGYAGHPYGYGYPGALAGADKNKDGIVDTKEYTDAVKAGKLPPGPPGFPGYGHPGYGGGPPWWGGVPWAGGLAGADKNKDGIVDSKEFAEAVKSGKLPPVGPWWDPTQPFVDLVEADEIPFSPGNVRAAVAQRIMKARTTSGEGVFDASAAAAASLAPHFSPGYGPYGPYGAAPFGDVAGADKNKDGVVDAKEYQEAVKKGKLHPGYAGYPGYGYAGYPGYGAPWGGAWGAAPWGDVSGADKNKDGVVDGKEFADAVQKTGKFPGYAGAGYPGYGYAGHPGYGAPWVGAWGAGAPWDVNGADKNKDGVVDRKEFADAVNTGKLPGYAGYGYAGYPGYGYY